MSEVKNNDSFLKNLLTGIHITFRGLGIFFKRPTCWLYSIVPVFISILFYAAGVWLFIVYIWPHLPWAEVADSTLPWWRQWLQRGGSFLLAAMLIIIYLTLFVFTFSALYMVVGAPFFDRMAAKLEKQLYGYEMQLESNFSWFDYFRTSITNALILTIQSILCTLILLPICIFLPYVGFFPFMLALGYLLGWSFLLYGAEHRRWRRKDVKRALKGKRGIVLAFGGMVYLILFIPFAAILAFPAAVVSGVIIFNEHIDPRKEPYLDTSFPPALESPPDKDKELPVAETD